MAVTLRIWNDPGGEHGTTEPLVVTLDAPRVVIGRSKSCDVQLLDPTVSARHAVLRLQGGGNMVSDEGSTNGIAVGPVRLPPRTPRMLREGEWLRVGRVWMEVSFVAGVPMRRSEIEAVAVEHLRRQLAAEGEDVTPRLEVVAGPDAGASLVLQEARQYVLGRARDADLQLRDPSASRRHVAVEPHGTGWVVRDLAEKVPATLDDVPVDGPLVIEPGQRLVVGDDEIRLVDPFVEVVDDAWRAKDVALRPEELDQAPPGVDAAVVEAPEEAIAEEAPVVVAPRPRELVVAEPDAPTAWLGTMDVVVALLATTLLVVSGLGLAYVLG